MNTTASSFTPLESLLLFQSILKYGIDAEAFARISTTLRNNSFIKGDDSYNADRLSSESLQQLFLHLLRDELKPEEHTRSNGDDAAPAAPAAPAAAASASSSTTGSRSPTSKKRKLSTPPLAILSDASAHPEQLPALVERLYARYRDQVVSAIREDERRIEKVQGEIRFLERHEANLRARENEQRAQNAKAAGTTPGAAPAVPPLSRPAGTRPPNGTPAAAVPTPALAAAAAVKPPLAVASTRPGPTAPPTAAAVPAPAVSAPYAVPPPRAGTAQTRPHPATPQPAPTAAMKPERPAVKPILPGTASPALSSSSAQPIRTPGAAAAVAAVPAVAIPAAAAAPAPAASASATAAAATPTPAAAPAAGATPVAGTTPVAGAAPVASTVATIGAAATDGTTTAVGSATAPHPPNTPSLPAVGKPPATVLSTKQQKQQGPAGRPISPAKTTQTAHPPQAAAQSHLQPKPAQSPTAGQTAKLLPVSAQTQAQPGTPATLNPPGAQMPVTTPPTIIPSVPQAQQLPKQPQLQPYRPPPPPPVAEPKAEVSQPAQPSPTKAAPAAILPQTAATPRGQRTSTPTPVGPQPAVADAPTSNAPAAAAAAAPSNSLSNRPLLPDHVVPTPGSATPTPTQSRRPILPHTPVHVSAAKFIPRGSGTRWKQNEPTPSTPGPDVGDMASPAYEPLSPVLTSRSSHRRGSAAKEEEGPSSLRVGRQSKKHQLSKPIHKHEPTGRPRGRPPRVPRLPTDLGKDDESAGHPKIKDEVSTPNALDEVGETTTEDGGTVDESPSAPSARNLKRKRDESVEFLSPSKPRPQRQVPQVPPSHVLWMRGFPKISASALDQISSHRHANMFAHKIRDRDAPGYGNIVRHPVDLKSIRMAISQGNKAATAAAASLLDAEQAASSVWLPISEELVPPRGIINSSQLECELVHMFANAVMYNPDSHRGPGPAFMMDEPAEDEVGVADGGNGSGAARYQVDEDGVVNDTRDMYIEVEKLLSEMRSAEKQRGVPPPPSDATGLVLQGLSSSAEAASENREDETDAAATEDEEEEDNGNNDDDNDNASEANGQSTTGTIKRRRITRGQ